jgi:hypothetical protein
MATKSTKRVIRNLHPMPVNLRFGSKRDPYHITLQRRGQSGDYVEVPGDIAEHPDFNRNVGLTFEIISVAEAKKIQYGDRSAKTAIETDKNFKLERMSDLSTTIGHLDAKGNLTRTDDVNPMRSRAVGTTDNPVPAERPSGVAKDNGTPPVSPDLPAFGGVQKA